MEDFQFQRRGPAAAQPGKVAAGGRAKPAARYDDVFGGPPRSSPVPARPEDYREIFGAAAACSIPVLDLPPPPEDGYELHQCSALDYLDIFGGGDFAATYHELFASQVSNGIGAPLPSELGSTASVIDTSNSRESKGMGFEKQEMPVSGNITEGRSRDQFGCSLNGVALHLNDETNLLNSPTHMAIWRSKSEAVNVTIHKNQAQMVPGFAYIVKDPDIDKSNSEVDIITSFDSNSSKETSEQHLKKAELSGDWKYSVSTMKGDQRSIQLEVSGSMIASTNKDNTSFSSKNQPAIPISNGFYGFSAKTSNYQSPHENLVEKKAEGKCQSKTVTNCTDTGCQSNLKVRLAASEDVRPNEEHLSCSYKDHLASCNVKLSPDCSIYDFTSDGGNTRVAEANHFKKSMPEFPSCIISQSSEDKTTEQKMSNSIPDPQKDVTVNECVHSRSSSCQSISSLDRSCLDSTFLTVSDINLRTQPSQGPPPVRPPPGRPPSKFGNSGRNLRRTLTDYQNRDVETATTYKTHSFKQSVRDGSSPFDLEADVSSAAAASVAAIKEAMELAQAKLKSAKVSRERMKGNLQSRRKLGLNEDLRNTTKDEHQTVQDNQRTKEDMVVQLSCGNTDGQDNDFAAQKKMIAFTPSLLTGDFKEKEIDTRSAEAELSLQAKHWGEPEVSSVSNIKEDRVGEWKIAEQFYEFIQSEKKLSKVPDNSLNGDTEKKSNTTVGIIEEEQNASELKRRENLLEPPKFVVWEGDSDRCQNPCSPEPSLEFDMPWNCSLRQTETVNAHCQEKQPGEIQELLNTQQKTEWRASEEGFICELSKKNLRVNKDALKCKPSYGCQGPEKVQNGADETFGCEETQKDINVTDDYLKDHGEENIVLGKLSKLDGNKTEANMFYVSNVSGKDAHLKAGCINYEYGSFTESWNVEPKEASLLFGQDNGNIGKTSKLPHQPSQWAKNENELKVPLDIPDVEGKDGTAGALEDFKGKVMENMQEVQVIDSNEVLKSAQDGWNGTGNIKKVDDAQKVRSLGGQQYILKVLPEFPGNEDAGSPVENDAHAHETRVGKGDKRVNAEMSDLDKVSEMKRIEVEEKMLGEAKERERKKLKEEKERDKKLEEEKKWESIRLEKEERERVGKKLEEERKLKRLEEEKAKKKLLEEREKRLEEERETKRLEEERKKRLEEERERKMLEDEERENKRLEKAMEKKRLEEENERKRLEDEEREKKRLEEERERKKLEDEERKKKRLEEERKKKKLEDEEREKKRLEEEKERKKLENEQREKKKLEEEERKKLGDEEREKKRLQEENEREKSEKEDRERKKSVEAEERKKLEEERESREREEKERIRKKQEEEDMERSKLEEKERERRKQEEERERRRLEEIERERRKLEEKVRERKRIEEEEKVRERQKIEEEKAREKKLDEEKGKDWRKREEEKEREREREREKDRQAVERATREAHERSFAEARERVERAAVERITAEARQRALAEARERAEKASAETLEKFIAEKVSREARLRSERAAVERATAEARERAVEKAIAEKAALDARERAEKLATPSREGVKQNFSNVRDCDPQFQNVGSSRSSYQKHPDSNASFMNETSGGSEGESAIRCKARMERHQRTIERAAKALAEKNLRDIIAQREQAERNRLAETLDADVKRWSNGKEGNLRALLSTLQYILGPESGWHPIPLTDVVTAPAVKKAYRKATLCVHPDKLQQRGASIHQKYICQKVFDLLKEAWNKFNSEER